LLRRIARQDRRAFDELYHAYYRRLSRFLQRLTPRYQFAEEIINDTFWVVWNKAGEFRGTARVSTWIMGIAYRRALHGLRDERRSRDPNHEQIQEDSCSTDELGESHDVQDWVAQGLQTLPTEQRIALELAYFMVIPAKRSPRLPGVPSAPSRRACTMPASGCAKPSPHWAAAHR
jgi:RNA polymerase sigma-70 factor (ECF subfamily)